MKAALAVIALALLSPFAKAELGPGSPAPALSVKTWYKGEPVNEIGKTGTYVVEFWATWCGPCIESIPHLTETAHKNPDVTFIGVSVWEEDKDGNIKKFVDKMGDKMDYHVGYSGNQDGMALTWMKAAAQNGIPAAFVVKDGVIQWVGHPMSVEKPLAEIKAGTFDLANAKLVFGQRAVQVRKQMALNDEIRATDTLFDSGKHAEAKAKLAKIVSEHPEIKSTSESINFLWLARENPKAWEAEATKMAKSKDQASIQKLRSFALGQSSNAKADLKQVRKAIDLALSSSDKPDPLTLQYAVLVYENLKDYKHAADLVTKLVSVLPNNAENKELRNAMNEKKAELVAKAQK